MLVKLQDVPQELVDELKLKTGHVVASRAFSAAADAYLDQLNMIARLEREAGHLKERCRVQQQIIDRARDSASALLVHVAQGDLLNG